MGKLATRGLMLDLARGMERQDYYFDLLPWLREWGYNLLHLHLIDDQGCRLVFPSRPELASAGAFDPSHMRRLVAEARRCGIEVIPEIECLGHASLLNALPCFGGRRRRCVKGSLNALDPEHPATRPLLEGLLRDAAEIFSGGIIHVGLDEVGLSSVARYRTAPEDRLWRVFAEHASWVHDTVRHLGKRPAMWGDHILSCRKMAALFSKDLIVFDWHYRPGVNPESVDFLTSAGFETWGAPATVWWQVRLASGPPVFQNIREFSKIVRDPKRKRATGIVNTVWCSWRYLPGAIDWPVAWAGGLFSSGRERAGLCRRVCADFYGLDASSATRTAEAVLLLHAVVPDGPTIDAVMEGGARLTPHIRQRCEALFPQATAGAELLEPIVPKARRHAERLGDLYLSARLLQRWAARGAGRKVAPDPGLLRQCRRRWKEARPYPTPVFPDAGRWQHILRLAADLCR